MGGPDFTVPEVTLIIRPQRASRIAGTTARAQKKAPVMLTSIALFHSSTGSSQNGAMVIRENTAALLISTSIRPKAESAASAIAPAAVSFATSVSMPSARPPPVSISAWTLAALSPFMSATTGIAPCAAKWCAKPRPIPWPPPVITTTRFFRLSYDALLSTTISIPFPIPDSALPARLPELPR